LKRFAIFPISYPAILGSSFAGSVVSVGSAVTRFKVGDRVVVSRSNSTSADNRFGAYQKFPLASEASTARLDPSVPFHDASATVANLATIVSALSIHLKLPLPSLTSPAAPSGKKILIYGGSSSVGGLGVKYASDAGYQVITTSSPANRSFVKASGAAHTVDHTLPAEKLLAELKSNGPYDAIFDAIGTPEVTSLIGKLLADEGGIYYTTLPPVNGDGLPPNVERRFASYRAVMEEEANAKINQWFYEEYLPYGLATGKIIPTRTVVAEGGLEGVQGVLNRLNAGGVSGRKFVLNPQG
jgi:NADPH:quinone reductase-like Zn-dependent oxidoreductase